MNAFGCRLSQKDLRDAKFKKSLLDKINLPVSYKINAKMPQVKNQGVISSCVAHAIATILEYYCKDDDTKLSTNFIYGIRNKLYNESYEGMSFRSACKIANKYGDMLYDDCPGNNEITEVFDIADKAFSSKSKLRHAYKHRIKSYINLFNSKIFIKYFIANYGPVLGNVPWYMLYEFEDDKFTIKFNKITKSNYHAIVIWGWDEEGWICQNSWGKVWGNKGYFRLRYEDGPIEAFGLIDDKTLDDLSDVVTDPTYGKDLIDEILKFINTIIAKFTTK